MEKINSSVYDSEAYSQSATNDYDYSRREREISDLHLTSPLSIWIILMFLSALTKVAISSYSTWEYYAVANQVTNFILLVPGVLLFPLLIGLINGIRIGSLSGSINKAINASIYNGIYNSVVFTVSILVVYEIMSYIPQLPTTMFIIKYWVVLPLIILLILPVVVAMIAYLKKKTVEDIRKR